jgi:ElaA protein
MGESQLNWRCLRFADLSVQQLHDLLALRSAVFVVEQSCVFQDIDGLDPQAVHVLGHDEQDQLQASSRCFAPGVVYAEASIGRVVTAPTARGTGLGHQLMRQAMACVQAHWGPVPIRIGAQSHLQAFYDSHGFVTDSEPYLEDGIWHVQMLLMPA